MNKRIIGAYEGDKKGPLLIVLGAIHGNEPAGVKAIDYVLKMLEVEPITNQRFSFSGKIVGLIGNRQAYKQGQRYIDEDLNRAWTKATVEKVKRKKSSDLGAERQEMKALMSTIQKEVKRYRPEKCIILDIHTTSSTGGIFVIPGPTDYSLELSKSLNAPVITGILEGIKGTIMHFFSKEKMDTVLHTLTFEAGQHKEELSVNRAIAAIINTMKALQMVDQKDVENVHDEILTSYSRGLPTQTHLQYKYEIKPTEIFKMKPGYKNFDRVTEGEHLADSNGVPVLSPQDGLILMPLYQKQGSDGFFIVSVIQQ